MKTQVITSAAAIALFSACNSVEQIDIPASEPPVETGGLVEVEVLDYSPAPGQFVNVLPAYEKGDDSRSMCLKAQKSLNSGKDVSLGAWGGSITIKISKAIENIDGYDFRVRGNAYISGVDKDGLSYGSCEPGIVEVMCDDNDNGLPDDTWYELRGSRYDEAVRGLTVTFHEPLPDATNEQYIQWTASDGAAGWINRVDSYHKQPFFPQWLAPVQSMTFTGVRLPDNGRFNELTGRYDLYNWQGYADAYPDLDEKSALDISSAVDADGRFVHLERIHFVRITTGVLQCNGPLGECSTEVSGIEVL